MGNEMNIFRYRQDVLTTWWPSSEEVCEKTRDEADRLGTVSRVIWGLSRPQYIHYIDMTIFLISRTIVLWSTRIYIYMLDTSSGTRECPWSIQISIDINIIICTPETLLDVPGVYRIYIYMYICVCHFEDLCPRSVHESRYVLIIAPGLGYMSLKRMAYVYVYIYVYMYRYSLKLFRGLMPSKYAYEYTNSIWGLWGPRVCIYIYIH